MSVCQTKYAIYSYNLGYLQLRKLFYFSFKSHHFPTYLLCMITYNNTCISRPVHDPAATPTTPSPKYGGSQHPNCPGLTPIIKGMKSSVQNQHSKIWSAPPKIGGKSPPMSKARLNPTATKLFCDIGYKGGLPSPLDLLFGLKYRIV